MLNWIARDGTKEAMGVCIQEIRSQGEKYLASVGQELPSVGKDSGTPSANAMAQLKNLGELLESQFPRAGDNIYNDLLEKMPAVQKGVINELVINILARTHELQADYPCQAKPIAITR